MQNTSFIVTYPRAGHLEEEDDHQQPPPPRVEFEGEVVCMLMEGVVASVGATDEGRVLL